MKLYLRLLVCVVLSFVSANVFATHLRAGEITAKRISNTSLTYRVTLTTYTDEKNGYNANNDQNIVFFYFGFSTNQATYYPVSRKKKTLISPSTMCNVYDTTFTFPAAGTYKLTCGISNRNANTLNLPGKTDEISFFVETTIYINSSLGLNSTPILLNIPIDSAGVGKKFIHNPGAFDADGDSLSYRLTIPKKDKGDATGIGISIDGYKAPTSIGISPILDETGTNPASFRIDARTGDLIWDAPQKEGQYNVAFIVEEWRRGADGTYIKIGEITRDMQIIVVETPNNRPLIQVPADICVEAGQKIQFKVTATDKDKNDVKITTSSGIYNKDQNGATIEFISPEAATFSPLNTVQKSPATGTFTWQTNCKHVRQQAYDVLFKVEDFPGRFNTQLVDIKTIKINVLPPRPKGLVAVDTTEGVRLSWQRYPDCSTSAQIIIYRKDGCSGSNVGDCQQGIPSSWGYREIGRVANTDTVFIDKSTAKGSIYSYRLVADLPVSQFVSLQSGPSTEFCLGSELPKSMPIITNVSIDTTSTQNGQITVKWTQPLDLDTTLIKRPYQYKVYRASGIDNDNFSFVTSLNQKTDTLYVDKNLNTENTIYRYKVEFYYESTKKMGETSPASSVRLAITPNSKQLQLSWQANVPWSNENQKHRIYREVKGKAGEFNLIAEMPVSNSTTFNYTDNGEDKMLSDGNTSIELVNDSTYCYKVETIGTYSKNQAKIGLLSNYSQVFCAAPADNSPPCSPVLASAQIDCENVDPSQYCQANFFTNVLNWSNPANNGSGRNCRKDIVKYNIYYARYKDEAPKYIASTDANVLTFSHQRDAVNGFAGCYYITAVNSLNSESSASNIICKDNCPSIGLPNVFTPNGDLKNDTFAPLNCPAFVANIDFEVYNRYGLKVFSSVGETLNWDGTSSGGQELPAGTYYYTAKVKFNRLDKNDDVTSIKGWVQLIR